MLGKGGGGRTPPQIRRMWAILGPWFSSFSGFKIQGATAYFNEGSARGGGNEGKERKGAHRQRTKGQYKEKGGQGLETREE
jgi:hypothetical protein